MVARIAEAGGMDMKVFPRDANTDIMDEFLKNGEFQSIPTVVFYTKDYNYLFHWIERPAQDVSYTHHTLPTTPYV